MILISGPAHAAVTTTTPFVSAPTDTVECGAISATTVIRTVRIQIVRSFDGAVLVDSGTTPVAVSPGAAFGKLIIEPIDEVYCRFIANASTVRGSLNVRSPATAIDRLVLPAR